MKLTTFLPLILAATSAVASSLTRDYDVIKARQAKVHRDLVDVCVGLDVDLELLEILRDGKPLVTGHIDVCLCVSLLPSFCKSNAAASTAALLVGEAKVIAILEGLINSQNGKQSCKFPEHSHSICSGDNPCGFGCDDGYSPYTAPGDAHPSSCHCPAPMTECNGKCGNFPHGCGSAVPVKRRNHRRTAQFTCSAGQNVCGVSGGKGWDCVDTTKDKESCGGCVIPSPFSAGSVAKGVDCTSIAHVDKTNVECRSQSCFVHSCQDGFVPSDKHDSCVAPGVNVGVVEAVKAAVSPLVVASEAGVAGVHVGRSVAAAALEQGLVDVHHVVKLGEGAGLALKVHRRDIPLVGAVVGAVAGADVANVVGLGAIADAGARVL